MRYLIKHIGLVTGFCVVFTLSLVAGIVYPFVDSFVRTCKSELKTFEYEGCSINYQVVSENERCTPCGGIIPCPSGFNNIEKLQILNCLCENDKSEQAQAFAKQYMLGSTQQFENLTVNPDPKYGIESITRTLDEEQIQRLCNELPLKSFYL